MRSRKWYGILASACVFSGVFWLVVGTRIDSGHAPQTSPNTADPNAALQYAALLLDHGSTVQGMQVLRSLMAGDIVGPGRRPLASQVLMLSARVSEQCTDSGMSCLRANRLAEARTWFQAGVDYLAAANEWQRTIFDSASVFGESMLREGRINLAFICYAQGDLAGARRACAADADARRAFLVKLLGHAHEEFDQRNYAAARKVYFDVVQEFSLGNVDSAQAGALRSQASYSLAMSELLLNDVEAARRDLQESLRYAPPGSFLVADIQSTLARIGPR